LKSNVAPSDSEIVTIRALISEVEARIEELHHNNFPESQATESRLLKFIQVHKALLSPVRYLPSEILQEIFLHYCDQGFINPPISLVPWRLGHISHRWREIALALPALWDKIPVINLDLKSYSNYNPFFVRAITHLMERSGTSPTLNCHISYPDWLTKIHKSPIFKAVVRHSERLESLSMCLFDMHITTLFQGLKGHLPNLRSLRLTLPSIYSNDGRRFDMFETAPALRRIVLQGSYPGDSIRLLLPWSQITHLYDTIRSESVAPYVPLSFLPSLSYLYIDKDIYQASEGAWILSPALRDPSTHPSHYEPVTLSGLHTLKVHGHCNGDTGIFLDSLTIPAVEVIKISFPGSLVPHLVSMFSRSHEPSRLQKLAFRSIPLQEGELSTLLNLVPQLIELDISVPPMADILRLIDCEGDVILVPMLRALYMHDMDGYLSEWMECFKNLAQVRCELGCKDSKDAIKPSLTSRNTLDMLRVIFDSAGSRHMSQAVLNDWYYSPEPEEDEAVDLFFNWSVRLRTDLFKDDGLSIPSREHSNYLGMLDELFTCIELCEAITINVLHVGNSSLHMVYMKRYTYIIVFFLPFR
jgi:F-box-like